MLGGLGLAVKGSWNISQEPGIKRHERFKRCLWLKMCIRPALDLLTNCTVVDDVIRFINNHKQKQKEEVEEDDKEEVASSRNK